MHTQQLGNHPTSTPGRPDHHLDQLPYVPSPASRMQRSAPPRLSYNACLLAADLRPRRSMWARAGPYIPGAVTMTGAELIYIINIYMCTYAYMYMCTYIYIYACAEPLNL